MPVHGAALSVEAEIVVLCSRSTLSQRERSRLQSLVTEDPDWKLIATLSHRHEIYPLLFKHLSSLQCAAVSQKLLSELARLAGFRARKSCLLSAELMRVKRVLQAQQIEFRAFKGPALAAQAYEFASERLFQDLDLIVEEQDVARAQATLIDAGYRPDPAHGSEMPQNFMFTSFFRQLTGAQSFIRQDAQTAYALALHWRGPRSAHQVVAFDDQATEVSIRGGRVRTLNPELSLLFLVANGTDHHWTKLKCLVDIVQILKTQADFNWQKLSSLATEYSMVREVDLALLLCRRLLGLPRQLPHAVLVRITNDAALATMCTEIFNGWFHKDPAANRSLHKLLRYRMDTADSLFSLIKFGAHKLFSPDVETYSRIPLPQPMAGLYCVLKPILAASDVIQSHMPRAAQIWAAAGQAT